MGVGGIKEARTSLKSRTRASRGKVGVGGGGVGVVNDCRKRTDVCVRKPE